MTAHFRKKNFIRKTNSPKVANVLMKELEAKEKIRRTEEEARAERRVTAITIAVILAAGTIVHCLNKDAPRLVLSREPTPNVTGN